MNPHCRIGRVTMKASNVVVLPGVDSSGSIERGMLRDVHELASYYPGRMGGYALVAWNMEGRWARGIRLNPKCFIGLTMLPSFVAEVLRRDISADVTKEVLRGEA